MFVWIGETRWIRWRWVRRVRLYADRRRAPQPLSTAEGDRSLSWSEDGRTIAARKRRWKGGAARSRESRNSVWAKMQDGPPQQTPGGPNKRRASVKRRSNRPACHPRVWRNLQSGPFSCRVRRKGSRAHYGPANRWQSSVPEVSLHLHGAAAPEPRISCCLRGQRASSPAGWPVGAPWLSSASHGAAVRQHSAPGSEWPPTLGPHPFSGSRIAWPGHTPAERSKHPQPAQPARGRL